MEGHPLGWPGVSSVVENEVGRGSPSMGRR